MVKILVLEDDEKLNYIICTYLSENGFQIGIDDYMMKPVDLAELLMRVRTLLRRANIEMNRKMVVGYKAMLGIVVFWIVVSAGFTIATRFQLNYHYQRPVEELGGIETLKSDILTNVFHEIKTLQADRQRKRA